jgi:hypothetical protein
MGVRSMPQFDFYAESEVIDVPRHAYIVRVLSQACLTKIGLPSDRESRFALAGRKKPNFHCTWAESKGQPIRAIVAKKPQDHRQSQPKKPAGVDAKPEPSLSPAGNAVKFVACQAAKADRVASIPGCLHFCSHQD